MLCVCEAQNRLHFAVFMPNVFIVYTATRAGDERRNREEHFWGGGLLRGQGIWVLVEPRRRECVITAPVLV